MLNCIIRRHINRRKLLRNLKTNPDLKNLTKSPSLDLAISHHEEKWDMIDVETFQPLSDSIKNEPSKYKHFTVSKKKLNERIRHNYKKMVDLTSDVMVAKEAPVISTNADIVNRINSIELKRFKKAYFVKETTKRILDREKSLGFNYVNTAQVPVDKELAKCLERVKGVQYDNSEFRRYIETVKALKNSKIDDMLYLNDEQDRKLAKYLLPTNSTGKEARGEETRGCIEANGLNTANFLIETNYIENRDAANEQLIQLSKEDYERCKAIINYENTSFEVNRDIFAPKNRFSELGTPAKLFYLKQKVNTTKDVLSMSQYYITSNSLPEMMLPFYKRIAEISIHAANYYENPEFADLLTVSDPNYKPLLKRNIQLLGTSTFHDLAEFYQGFMNLHKRENGRILGKVYQKANYSLLRRFLHTAESDRDAVIDSPFDLSLVLECMTVLRDSYSYLLENEKALETVIGLIADTAASGDISNTSTNTRIFNFLSQLYADRPNAKDVSNLTQRYELLFQQNLNNLINPANLDDLCDNICKIAPLMTKAQIIGLNLKLKDQVLPRIKENISLGNLSALSTYLVNFSSTDFQLYHFIRKNTFTLFSEANSVNVTDLLRLLNNSGYMEVANTYGDYFNSSESISLVPAMYFKHIYHL